MPTPTAPQPDPDPDGTTLVENEGVNAGSAVPEPDDAATDRAAEHASTDGPGPGRGPQATGDDRPQQPHTPDAGDEPGVAVTDADLYGAESGQDSGSMA